VWSSTAVPTDDPLRQGDLLLNVDLPKLKRPIPAIPLEFKQRANMQLPYARQTALVVSSCCANANEEYLAVAPVQPLGGLTDEQEEALLRMEPPDPDSGVYGGYDIDHFRLDPLVGFLVDPPHAYQAAFLARAIPFWGDCSDLRGHRIARMTVEARRLLRLNLSLLWSRVEQSDAEELRSKGLPVWFNS
jgi:hypothetical protein